ncbi:MAG: SDR family NAD(P)-dependent oxidoreductase, partial [Proteobacteria bacterium]|nr:SDR family NAD(P)-dependent oxidoreductase [Pseudomonadota bacterium]
MRFQGKIVLVTGAARGVGKVIAKAFAQKGASVIINDIDLQEANGVAQEMTREGFEAMAAKADVSRGSEVEAMINEVIAKYGKIDILVNNAAVFAESVLIMELEEEEWDRVMNVNLKGVFNCSKAVMRNMINQKSGKIINIASFVGKTGRVVYSKFGTPTKAHYCASKAGVISLTKSLAFELAPHNINVNAVAPGSIDPGGTEKGKRDMITPLVPLGRMGTSEDVAAAVLFLA